jgi:protein gp37
MSTATKIEWTRGDDGSAGATWNPVTGCTKVSPGCDHCYAETFAERWRGVPGHPYEQGFDVRLWPERLELPLRWRKPRRVFVNSMSDLFIGADQVPDAFVAEVFAVMALAARHTFQVLTKRPGRMASLLSQPQFAAAVGACVTRRTGQVAPRADWLVAMGHWPLPNVWLGTSVELGKYAWRADRLRGVPAVVRFLSLEPLLGPLLSLDLTGIDWAIIGGESGHDARPMDLAWARSLVQQCREGGVAPFVKQLGAHPFDSETGLPWLCRSAKGGDISEFPADLRVREYPREAAR